MAGKAQWMSWFIVILMTGSMLIMFATAPERSESGPIVPPPSVGQPTVISFEAESVDANIVEVFPSLFLIAQTDEADIGQIDTELFQLGGRNIGKFNSYYKGLNQTEVGGALTYIAEVTFSKGFSLSQFVSELGKQSILLNEINAFARGLVVLEKSVLLVNSDLNLSKEYSFVDPLAQAFLNLDSVKGDQLQVFLRVSFTGEQVSELIAYEVKNNALDLKQVNFVESFPVELMPEMHLYGSFPYSKQLSEEKLKEELLAVEGVNSAELSFSELIPELSVSFEEDVFAKHSDLNAVLSNLWGVKEVKLNEKNIFIGFDFNVDYSQLLSDIGLALKDLGLENYSLNEPKIFVNSDLNLSTNSTQELSDSLQKILSSKAIDAELMQSALVKTDSLTDPDTNGIYVFPEKGFKVSVKPGHADKEHVKLSINFVSRRNSILFAEGREAEEQENN